MTLTMNSASTARPTAAIVRANDNPVHPHAERREQQEVSSADRVGLRSWRQAQDVPRRQRAITEQR